MTTRSVNKHKSNAWISSSFDSSSEGPPSRKRPKANDANSCGGKRDEQSVVDNENKAIESWVLQSQLTTAEDSAVNKKKLAELRQWLTASVGTSRILLLTGPSGCGKTSTLRALCEDMQLNIVEWQDSPVSSLNELYTESHSAMFRDFLLKAPRYNVYSCLDNNSGSILKCVLLVKELPQFLIRLGADGQDFREMLALYRRRAKVPLVFVVSTAHSESSDSGAFARMFSPALVTQCAVDEIKFLPIAISNMKTALGRTLREVYGKESCSAKNVAASASQIVQEAGGDVRKAINAMHFWMSGNDTIKQSLASQKRVTGKGSRLKKNSEPLVELPEKTNSPIEDESLSLFHVLGKILYCKRSECSQNTTEPSLSKLTVAVTPSSFLNSAYARVPLSFNPEQIIASQHQNQHTLLMNMLVENLPDFCDSIDELALAMQYVSLSDIIIPHLANVQHSYRGSQGGDSEEAASQMACLVAVRGVCYARPSGASRRRTFAPFRRPSEVPRGAAKTSERELVELLSFRKHFCTTPNDLLRPSIDGRKPIAGHSLASSKLLSYALDNDDDNFVENLAITIDDDSE